MGKTAGKKINYNVKEQVLKQGLKSCGDIKVSPITSEEGTPEKSSRTSRRVLAKEAERQTVPSAETCVQAGEDSTWLRSWEDAGGRAEMRETQSGRIQPHHAKPCMTVVFKSHD